MSPVTFGRSSAKLESRTSDHGASRQHILTISLEDYFQGAAFRNVLTRTNWSRFEQRIDQNTTRALDMLASFRAKATFFVSTWLAERVPEIIRRIAEEGHEIGSSGVTGRSFRELSEPELREEARYSRILLEELSQRSVHGFRVADHRLRPADLWALRVLAEEGYAYDSSVTPNLWFYRSHPQYRVASRQVIGKRNFWELPLPAIRFAGLDVPIAGGNYMRQLPEPLLRRAVNSWMQEHEEAFTFYFRLWDLDPEQPEITGAPFLSRLRHYRNAATMPAKLQRVLSGLRLISAGEYLDLRQQIPERVASQSPFGSLTVIHSEPFSAGSPVESGAKPAAARQELTLVVPCLNEADTLPYLSNALRQLKARMSPRCQLYFVFVDDGSSDRTWLTLHSLFGSMNGVELMRHATNRGVAAAIMTGVRSARTELVCSIDCDCTYDPVDLERMILLMADDVDCVTASPYHPEGEVLNVPVWRLFLSSIASRCYRIVLGSGLHTFTSCFRIYRKSSIVNLAVREPGFVGIAEIVGRLQLEGGRVVEYPTTLSVRVLGRSKMKLVRNTAQHVRLLLKLAAARGARKWTQVAGQRRSSSVAAEPAHESKAAASRLLE